MVIIITTITLASIGEKPKAGLDEHMEILHSPCLFMLLNICWKVTALTTELCAKTLAQY